MTDENKPADPKGLQGNAGNSTAGITRRRFTKAGAAAPLIMTLGSRPVWGQCVTPSGQLSQLTTGDASNHLAQGKFDCEGSEGMPASWWRNNPDLWISGYYEEENGTWRDCDSKSNPAEVVEVYSSRNDVTFETCGYLIPDPYQALDGDDLYAQLVAAKLNIQAGLNFGYSELTLETICGEWAADENDVLITFLSELNNRGGLTDNSRSDLTSVCQGEGQRESVLSASGAVDSAVAKI